MRTAAENRKVSAIIKSVRDNSLIPRPEFQRRSVWTNPDKIAFVETILGGYPFPEIYVASSSVNTVTGEATEILVDGQQRVRTIQDYFNGTRPFNSSRSVIKYSEMTEDMKKDFLNYDVAVRNLGILNEAAIREIFKRMNRTSYDLNDMERFNAVYLGEFKKFCEAVAQNIFFQNIRLFSPNDIRRMKDVSYIASLSATMLSGYFNRDEDVEEYLEQYNEAFSRKEEFAARFSAAVEYIRKLNIPSSSRAWRKADFYNLFVEVDRQLGRKKSCPDPEQVGPKLIALYDAVASTRLEGATDDEVERYFRATLQGTNDRGPRTERGAVVQSILESVPASPFMLDISVGKDVISEDEAQRAAEETATVDYAQDAAREVPIDAKPGVLKE